MGGARSSSNDASCLKSIKPIPVELAVEWEDSRAGSGWGSDCVRRFGVLDVLQQNRSGTRCESSWKCHCESRCPKVSPNPPTTPPAERTTPSIAEKDKAETAALSGFRTVGQVEPKIVRVQP